MPEKHPQLQDWIDYRRRTISLSRRLYLEELLNSGNAEAVALSARAALLMETAPVWGANVPEALTARAKAIFSAGEQITWERYPKIDLRLLFDSTLGLQPAGLRSGAGVSRETTHEAENLQLSLKVEQEEGTELTTVVGQLQAKPGSAALLAGRPVLVYRGDRMVARTLSGEDGEFQMEFSGRNRLRMVILLEQPERRIEMDLVPESGKRLKRDQTPGNQ